MSGAVDDAQRLVVVRIGRVISAGLIRREQGVLRAAEDEDGFLDLPKELLVRALAVRLVAQSAELDLEEGEQVPQFTCLG
ncbi:hypothetical protein [Sorangium sp. So ce1078]|uniref:hypothetical protein n=1 Tax=Sorangium sp. So ce1078 TaxID=3133329 RepID=UPI003F5D7A9B